MDSAVGSAFISSNFAWRQSLIASSFLQAVKASVVKQIKRRNFMALDFSGETVGNYASVGSSSGISKKLKIVPP